MFLQTENMFNEKFEEGLNQLLTVWLIENYSQKYKIQRNAYILIPTLKGKIKINIKIESYPEEVKMVKNILQEANVNLSEVFLNYINNQTEYFKSFVPSKYFKKSTN